MEVPIVHANGIEGLRHFETDNLIDERLQLVERFGRRHGHSQDQPLRPPPPERRDRGPDAGAGRDTVIDEHEDATLEEIGRAHV